MKNRPCTFTYKPEVEGNRKETTAEGITRSEVMMKKTTKGEFAVVFVEHSGTGELLEVFANTIKFTQ